MNRFQARGLAALFAYILAFVAIALLSQGVVHWHHRKVVLTQWASVTGSIRLCARKLEYPLSTRQMTGGVSLSISCDIDYVVDGRRRTASVRSPSRQINTIGGAVITYPFGPSDPRSYDPGAVAAADQWVDRNVPGTLLPLRYDPENPDAVSLAGLGSPMDTDDVRESVLGSVLFLAGSAMVALILIRTRHRV